MNIAEKIAHPAASTEREQQRHAISIPAIVAGLAPNPLPLVIRNVSRQAMYLAFDHFAAAIDAQWAMIGTSVTITFKAITDGYLQRVTLKGEIQSRDPDGIDVKLEMPDNTVRTTLRDLIGAIGTTRAA